MRCEAAGEDKWFAVFKLDYQNVHELQADKIRRHKLAQALPIGSLLLNPH
jgi:hypothetical protein